MWADFLILGKIFC